MSVVLEGCDRGRIIVAALTEFELGMQKIGADVTRLPFTHKQSVLWLITSVFCQCMTVYPLHSNVLPLPDYQPLSEIV